MASIAIKGGSTAYRIANDRVSTPTKEAQVSAGTDVKSVEDQYKLAEPSLSRTSDPLAASRFKVPIAHRGCYPAVVEHVRGRLQEALALAEQAGMRFRADTLSVSLVAKDLSEGPSVESSFAGVGLVAEFYSDQAADEVAGVVLHELGHWLAGEELMNAKPGRYPQRLVEGAHLYRRLVELNTDTSLSSDKKADKQREIFTNENYVFSFVDNHYEELFADTLAVVGTGDLNVIKNFLDGVRRGKDVAGLSDTDYRSFAKQYSKDNWSQTDQHTRLTPMNYRIGQMTGEMEPAVVLRMVFEALFHKAAFKAVEHYEQNKKQLSPEKDIANVIAGLNENDTDA